MGFSQKEKTWKILLIEDNPADTRLIQELIKEASVKTVLQTRNRISTGIKSLQDEKFDVILLDLTLPDASGLEALNKINNVTTDLPIIIISGSSDEALASTAVREGAQDYLLKRSIDSYSLSRSIQYAIERKQAENALYQTKSRLEYLLMSNPAVIYTSEPHGDFSTTFMSENIKELVGYEAQEFLRTPDFWVNLMHPEDRERIFASFSEIPEKGYYNETYRVQHKNGTYRWVFEEARLIEDEQGNPLEIVGYWSDVTGQKQSELKLLDSEEKYRLLVEKSLEGIVIIQDGRYKYVNPSFAKTVGYSVEDLINFSPDEIWALIHPDDKKDLEERNEAIKAGQQIEPKHTFRYIRKDGSTRWVEASGNEILYNGEPAMQVFEKDITVHKKMEEVILKERDLAQTYLDVAGVMIITIDIHQYVTLINERGCEILGYEEKDILGKHWLDNFVPVEIREDVKTVFDQLVAGEVAPVEYNENTILTKEGKERIIEWHNTVLKDKAGNITGILSSGEDITERKLAEIKIRESEEKYRTILENIEEGYYEVDLVGNFTFLNDSLAKSLGYSTNELMGMNNRQFMDAEASKKVFQIFNKVYQTGEPIKTFHLEIIRKDGTKRFHEDSVALKYDSEGKPIGFKGIARDITERKKTGKALQQRTHESEERIKEINCLYNVLKYTSNPERSLEEVILKILLLVPPAWQFPEITCARIILDGKVFNTDNFQETSWELSADVLVYEKKQGRIEVFYLIEKPESFEGPFLKEERDLIVALATELGDFIEFKRSEEALKESEDRYRTLFEGIPIGLYRTTPAGKFLAVNPAFLEMLGFSPSEDISLTDVAVVASKIDYPREKYQDIVETEGIVSGLELQVKKLDGSRIFIRENARIIKDSNGSILYYEGSLEDITERKLLEETLIKAKNTLEEKVLERTQDLVEEKQRIENILATIPEGVIVFNAKGEVLLVNNVFKEIYKRIYDKKLPKTLREFQIVGNPFADTISKLFYSKKEKTLTVEPLKAFHLQITSTKPLTLPDIFQGFIITVRDVSPFIEFEITQKQFIATVSHELRTPMTVLDLSIKNLQKYWEKLAEKQREEVFGLIIKSAFSLKQIVEDVLIISKIETRKFKLEKTLFGILKVLNDIIAQFDSRLKEFKVSVQLDVNPQLELYGDSKRIGKIFSILLDNAIKFSPDGESTVKIIAIDEYRGEYNPEDVDGVLIEVIDSGRGIPEKEIPHIFDHFFRSKDTKDVPGIGIGLFIAKTLIRHHHGHIFVKSMIGKGSTFSVFFPKIETSGVRNNHQ